MTPRTYGLLVNGQTAAAPPAPVVIAAILRKHGIAPTSDILPCKTAYAWGANCYAFVMPRGVVIGAAREAFKRVVVDQRVCIVELK